MSEPCEEDRPDIQKKVFGRWINAKLRSRDIFVTDLYFDLQDGEILLDLISGLTDRELKQEQVRHDIFFFFHALLTTNFLTLTHLSRHL
jgi:hypothetical protein